MDYKREPPPPLGLIHTVVLVNQTIVMTLLLILLDWQLTPKLSTRNIVGEVDAILCRVAVVRAYYN